MTRIYTDGAEMADALWWDYHGTSVAAVTPGASGSYCYSVGSNNTAYKNLPTSLTEAYMRFRFKTDNFTPNSSMAYYPSFSSGSSQIIWLSTNQTYYMKINTSGGVLASGSRLMTNDTWYILEMYLKIDDTVGRFVLKINGITDIDFTGDTKPSSYTSFNRLIFYGGANFVGFPTLYIDDIAINDTNGTEDNSWCGDGRVERLFPNADGDMLEWTPSSGSVHYTMVDEVPEDEDSTFVYTSASMKQDMYQLSTYTPTNKSIRRVWAEARAKDFSSQGKSIKIGVKTGSSVNLSASATVLESEPYGRIYGDVYTAGSSGSGWTSDELNVLQFVVESEN